MRSSASKRSWCLHQSRCCGDVAATIGTQRDVGAHPRFRRYRSRPYLPFLSAFLSPESGRATPKRLDCGRRQRGCGSVLRRRNGLLLCRSAVARARCAPTGQPLHRSCLQGAFSSHGRSGPGGRGRSHGRAVVSLASAKLGLVVPRRPIGVRLAFRASPAITVGRDRGGAGGGRVRRAADAAVAFIRAADSAGIRRRSR